MSKAEGATDDAYVCDQCWELLKNPVTAVPLLRGHVSIHLRETMAPDKVKALTEDFVRRIAKWRPRPKPV